MNSHSVPSIRFENLHPLVAEWIRRIPDTIEAWRTSEKAEGRLFPLPGVEGDHSEEINSDWKSHVQPELYEWFQSAQSIVTEDIKAMHDSETAGCTLTIPLAHADAWLNALNQARLTMAEVHGVSSGPENGEYTDMLSLQMDYYADMQMNLIEAMEDSSS